MSLSDKHCAQLAGKESLISRLFPQLNRTYSPKQVIDNLPNPSHLASNHDHNSLSLSLSSLATETLHLKSNIFSQG